MKKFILDKATGVVLNVIMVDPNNMPVLPSGQEYRDEAGGKGQHWNGAVWVHSNERLAQDERSRRDNKLVTHVDPIASNALRWATLSADQQGAWTVYRQALLDVPQQETFPSEVTWPVAP